MRNSLFPSDFLTKTFYSFLFLPLHAIFLRLGLSKESTQEQWPLNPIHVKFLKHVLISIFQSCIIIFGRTLSIHSVLAEKGMNGINIQFHNTHSRRSRTTNTRYKNRDNDDDLCNPKYNADCNHIPKRSR